MKKLIVTVAILVIISGSLIINYAHYANYGHQSETRIEKEYENLQNVLSQYTLKVAEITQVPSMYKDDMKEVMTAIMAARYGEGGSKAMFQWFKENNLNLDPSLYKKIQVVIEAGRNSFQTAQTRFIDIKATYIYKLGYVWSGFWLKLAGYPKINVGYPKGSQDDYPIVKSNKAIETFKTGVDKGLTLR